MDHVLASRSIAPYTHRGGGIGSEGIIRRSRLPHPSLTTALVIVATIAIGYLAITTTRYLVHNYQLRGQESDMRVQLHQLDQDHAQLIAVRDYLQSDDYVEQVAREVLGLVHPGETLVVVSQAASVPTATPAHDGETVPGEPWWKELFLPPTPAATPAPH